MAQFFSFLAETGIDFGFLAFLAAVVAAAVSVAVLVRAGQGQKDSEREDIAGRLEGFSEALTRQERVLREELKSSRSEAAEQSRQLREEVSGNMQRLTENVSTQMRDLTTLQRDQLNGFSQRLVDIHAVQERRLADQHESQQQALRELRDQLLRLVNDWKQDSAEASRGLSEGVTRNLSQFAEVMTGNTTRMLDQQKAQNEAFERRLNALAEANEQRGEALRSTVEMQLAQLRRDNSEKLEQMRTTVDEKLQGTLEQRLGESFRLVSERLEAVHKGLGEVQTLATGVGDLKRVLTNVKTRGGWGEVQLGALLEQMLAPNQFVANTGTSEAGNERVEYAIRLPGTEEGQEVLLPIDAKFPVEDYERLQAAAEAGDTRALELASQALEQRIKLSAKDISGKYINPPRTTDFAILFLPTEGLFAEVIRRAGLVDDLQRTHRVIVAGPTTLTALLSSLQMGFRTLAIQKRSGEVWQVLGAVKTEFGKFGPALQKVRKKLEEATNHIDTTQRRSRMVERKLKFVESLPAAEASQLLGVLDEDFEGPPEDASELA